jgi:hypothetical protein
MRQVKAPHNEGDTVPDVVEYFRCYLSRNRDLVEHYTEFLKRENGDPKAAESEAVVFSWLRAERLEPRLFEVPGKGGPDFCCSPTATDQFLVETTSLDSEMVSERSGLSEEITGPGGGPFALITDKLKAKAQSKASQLAGHGMPTALAITSDHAFSTLLLDRLAAEYLMTSAPQINVPLGGGPTHISTDLRHSVFQRANGLLDASGAPIIKPALRSIGAILLIAIDHRSVRIVGLLHPDAVSPFNPRWLPMILFAKFAGFFSPTNICTEWIQSEEGQSVATFPHRHIR